MIFRFALLAFVLSIAGCGNAKRSIDVTNNSSETLSGCNLRLPSRLIPFGNIEPDRGLVQQTTELKPTSRISIEWTDANGLKQSEPLSLPAMAMNDAKSEILSIERTEQGSFRVSWKNRKDANPNR